MNDQQSLSGNKAASLIKETSTAAFMRDVIEESSNQPVLVDFWAPWCGPCRQLTPIIEKTVTNARGRVKLVKLNIDDHPEIPGQMGIQSIPAVVAFKNGKPVDGFMGAVPESQINSFIDKIAGPDAPSMGEQYLEQAEKHLDAGEFEQAASYYSAVLHAEQDNIAAIAGLARAALGLGNLEQAQQILATTPQDKQNDAAIKHAEAQIALLLKASHTGAIETLIARIDANPDDHQSRYDLALALNAHGKREEAANALLEIFRRDRSWNEEAARKELLIFFEAWGPKEPATLKARRKLSSLMFA